MPGTYELLTIEEDPRPYVVVEHPSRVVFTLRRRDKDLAAEIVERLNNPVDHE